MPRFISLSYDSHITIGYVSLVSFTTTITLCGTLGSALVDLEIFLKDGDSRGSLGGSQAITPMPLTTNDAELDPNRMAWSSSLEAVSKLNPMRMPSISSLAKRTRSPPFPFPSTLPVERTPTPTRHSRIRRLQTYGSSFCSSAVPRFAAPRTQSFRSALYTITTLLRCPARLLGLLETPYVVLLLYPICLKLP
jgi:hypothetical protein